MPTYFFDDDRYLDTAGVEYTDDREARRAAMLTLPAIAAEQIVLGSDQQSFSMTVRDTSGRDVYSARITFDGFLN